MANYEAGINDNEGFVGILVEDGEILLRLYDGEIEYERRITFEELAHINWICASALQESL